MKRIMKPILIFLEHVLTVDWKAYTLSLIGFLVALTINPLSGRYGTIVGLVSMLVAWWLILGGLFMARRRDLPIWKIFIKK
jgi:hypothetical protein